MQNYAGTPIYPANVRRVEDGDERNATNLGAGIEDLADRTAAIARNVPGMANTHTLKVDIYRFVTGVPGNNGWSSSIGMAASGVPEHPYLIGGSTTNALSLPASIWWPLSPQLPPFGRITGFAVNFRGSAGGTYPMANGPILTLYALRTGETAYEQVQGSAAVATQPVSNAYETYHLLSGGVNWTIDTNLQYWLRFNNAYGSNSGEVQIEAAYVFIDP
jgi:hypothetical protein